MTTSAPDQEVRSSVTRRASNWRGMAKNVIGVVFILMGILDLVSGRAAGRWGLHLERSTEPALFWISVAAHVVAGCWLLIVPWESLLARRTKISARRQDQPAGPGLGTHRAAPLMATEKNTPHSTPQSSAPRSDKRVSIKCQHCSAEIVADHTKIGMVVDCPACGSRTKLGYGTGSTIPPTGWAISFSDFERLLDDSSNRKRVAPLVESWFDCEVQSQADGVWLRKNDGALLVRERIHEAIQADGQKQQQIYNVAMDLWR
jgi:DNA-directed RNA polymerase subunit RPC12/RpoP